MPPNAIQRSQNPSSGPSRYLCPRPYRPLLGLDFNPMKLRQAAKVIHAATREGYGFRYHTYSEAVRRICVSSTRLLNQEIKRLKAASHDPAP